MREDELQRLSEDALVPSNLRDSRDRSLHSTDIGCQHRPARDALFRHQVGT